MSDENDKAPAGTGNAGPSETGLGCTYLIIIASIILWAVLFARAAGHYREMTNYGYSGAWDVWVYLPLAVTVGLIAVSLFGLLRKSMKVPVLLGVVSLPLAFGYLLMTSGGV